MLRVGVRRCCQTGLLLRDSGGDLVSMRDSSLLMFERFAGLRTGETESPLLA